MKETPKATNQKVLFNAGSQFLGKVFTVLASFTVVKIVSGFGPGFYGNYVTAYEFLAFFGIIADAGLFTIAVKDMSKNPEKQQEIFGNIFLMRLGLICIVTIIAGLSAQLVPTYSPLVKAGVWITGLSMALTIVAGTMSSILQTRMKIHWFSMSLVLGKIILALLVFLLSRQFIFASTDPAELFFMFLWAGVFSNFIFTVFVFFAAKRELPLTLNFDRKYWIKTLKVSLPFGLALILQTLYLRIDLILISIILGEEPTGIYGVAARILESFLILGVFFAQAITPKITNNDSHETHEKTLNWGLEKLLIVSIPVIIATFWFAPALIDLLTDKSENYLSGPGFFGSDSVIQYLIITVLFAFFNQLFTITLVNKSRQNYLLIVNGLALLTNVILNLILLPKIGIQGAAISTIICELVVFALLTREVARFYNYKFNPLNITIIFGLNLALLLLYLYSPLGDNLLLAAILAPLVYLGTFGMLRKRFL